MTTNVTQILQSLQSGDEAYTAEQLLTLVYDELRKLAAVRMANEPDGQTLQPTALVHEAWIKLLGSNHQSWNNSGHFFGAAANAMRRILIDRARKRNRIRHGGGLKRINLDDVDIAATTDDGTLLELDVALEKFAQESLAKAELVKLRFYAGLTLADAAKVQGISLATAKRHWAYARSWLLCELKQ